MADPVFRNVSAQVSDPSQAAFRAGELFSKAFDKVKGIASDVKDTNAENVGAATEANTAKIISEIKANRDLKTVDQSSADIISGLANQFDGDINTGGFDLKAINQAASDHRGTLLEERGLDQTNKLNEQKLTKGVTDQAIASQDLEANPQRILDQGALAQAQIKNQKESMALSAVRTKIEQATLTKQNKTEVANTALNEIFTEFDVDYKTQEGFDRSMNLIRAKALASGVSAEDFGNWAVAAQLLPDPRISGSNSGNTLGNRIRAHELRRKQFESQLKNIDGKLAPLQGKNDKGESIDYRKRIDEEFGSTSGFKIWGDNFGGDELTQQVLPNVLRTLNSGLDEVNSKLQKTDRNEEAYIEQDVYQAISSGSGFDDGTFFTSAHYDLPKVLAKAKQIGDTRRAQLLTLRRQRKEIQNIQNSEAEEVLKATKVGSQ